MGFYGLGDAFKKKSKKAFSLTPQERKNISKKYSAFKTKAPKVFAKKGSQIDMGRLLGTTTSRLPFAKARYKPIKIKRRKKKKAKYQTVRIKVG